MQKNDDIARGMALHILTSRLLTRGIFSLCVEYSETWECPDGFEICSVCVLNIQRRGSVMTGLRHVQFVC